MQRGEGSPAYYLFDLLELERAPVIDEPLERRRELLEELLVEGNPLVRISTGFADGDGAAGGGVGAGHGGGRREAAGIGVQAGPADG